MRLSGCSPREICNQAEKSRLTKVSGHGEYVDSALAEWCGSLYFLSGEKEVSKIMKIGFVSLYAPGPLQSNERGGSPAAVAQS